MPSKMIVTVLSVLLLLACSSPNGLPGADVLTDTRLDVPVPDGGVDVSELDGGVDVSELDGGVNVSELDGGVNVSELDGGVDVSESDAGPDAPLPDVETDASDAVAALDVDSSGQPDTFVEDTQDLEVSADSGEPETMGDALGEVETDVAAPVCIVTASDVEGPYYLEGAPWTNVLADSDQPGQLLFLAGTVLDANCSPLPGAVLDVWQADASGTYDETPGSWKLRGRLTADANGLWCLKTILPGGYAMAGSFRPAHLHFKVSAQGHVPLTTQLYFEGDPYLQPNDPCSGCNSDEPTLIIALSPGTGVDAGMWSGDWTVVLPLAPSPQPR